MSMSKWCTWEYSNSIHDPSFLFTEQCLSGALEHLLVAICSVRVCCLCLDFLPFDLNLSWNCSVTLSFLARKQGSICSMLSHFASIELPDQFYLQTCSFSFKECSFALPLPCCDWERMISSSWVLWLKFRYHSHHLLYGFAPSCPRSK